MAATTALRAKQGSGAGGWWGWRAVEPESSGVVGLQGSGAEGGWGWRGVGWRAVGLDISSNATASPIVTSTPTTATTTTTTTTRSCIATTTATDTSTSTTCAAIPSAIGESEEWSGGSLKRIGTGIKQPEAV